MACSISLSHQVRSADVDGLEGVEDAEDDGQADRGLGRRQHDDEEGEGLAGEPAHHELVEGDPVDGGAVQHELDAHEDADCVAFAQGDRQADGEHQRADRQEVFEAIQNENRAAAGSGANLEKLSGILARQD